MVLTNQKYIEELDHADSVERNLKSQFVLLSHSVRAMIRPSALSGFKGAFILVWGTRLSSECWKMSHLHLVWFTFTLHFWKWTKPLLLFLCLPLLLWPHFQVDQILDKLSHLPKEADYPRKWTPVWTKPRQCEITLNEDIKKNSIPGYHQHKYGMWFWHIDSVFEDEYIAETGHGPEQNPEGLFWPHDRSIISDIIWFIYKLNFLLER